MKLQSNLNNTEKILPAKFVKTETETSGSDIVRIQCWGCSSFTDSLSALQDLMTQSSVTDTRSTTDALASGTVSGFCCHTMLIDQVKSIFNHLSVSDSQFCLFVKDEVSVNKQVTQLTQYGDTTKWLVVISASVADSEDAAEFAVCRTINLEDEVELTCESIRCIRGKSKKFKTNRINKSSICVHLRTLLSNNEVLCHLHCDQPFTGTFHIHLIQSLLM